MVRLIVIWQEPSPQHTELHTWVVDRVEGLRERSDVDDVRFCSVELQRPPVHVAIVQLEPRDHEAVPERVPALAELLGDLRMLGTHPIVLEAQEGWA